MLALDQELLGDLWLAAATAHRRQCGCKVKTQIVPAHGFGRWHRTAQWHPFGPAEYTDRATYLGHALCSTRRRGELLAPVRGEWSNRATAHALDGSWERATGQIVDRANTLNPIRASAGVRAHHWNTYMISCIPYPAQMGPPTCQHRRSIALAAKSALGIRWAPWYIWPAIGILYHIKGAPRCPQAVASAVTCIAFLQEGLWGPPGLGRVAAGQWRRMQDVIRQAREDPRVATIGAQDVNISLRLCRRIVDPGPSVDTRSIKDAVPGIYVASLLSDGGIDRTAWFITT